MSEYDDLIHSLRELGSRLNEIKSKQRKLRHELTEIDRQEIDLTRDIAVGTEKLSKATGIPLGQLTNMPPR
jgi:hypothetical protein